MLQKELSSPSEPLALVAKSARVEEIANPRHIDEAFIAPSWVPVPSGPPPWRRKEDASGSGSVAPGPSVKALPQPAKTKESPVPAAGQPGQEPQVEPPVEPKRKRTPKILPLSAATGAIAAKTVAVAL